MAKNDDEDPISIPDILKDERDIEQIRRDWDVKFPSNDPLHGLQKLRNEVGENEDS